MGPLWPDTAIIIETQVEGNHESVALRLDIFISTQIINSLWFLLCEFWGHFKREPEPFEQHKASIFVKVWFLVSFSGRICARSFQKKVFFCHTSRKTSWVYVKYQQQSCYKCIILMIINSEWQYLMYCLKFMMS